MGSLSTAYWQLTEIAKALAQDAQVLIMDEPTASLAQHETEALFELVERLKARGISIVYISHRMDEVYRIADRITILRDGQQLFTSGSARSRRRRSSRASSAKDRGRARIPGAGSAGSRTALLEARHLQAGTRVNDVCFTLHAGEILGLAGLMGSGRTELARVLFGIDAISSGEVLVRGQQVSLNNPRDASDARHRPDAGGPPAAGPRAGPLRPGEPAAAAAREAAARPVRLRPGRQGAGQGSAASSSG